MMCRCGHCEECRPQSAALRACYRPVTAAPPVRERRKQRDGQPRIKAPGLADRVWRDTVFRHVKATGRACKWSTDRIIYDFADDFEALK